MHRPWLAAPALVILSSVVLSAATITEIKLADGYDDVNTLKTPVVDNTGKPGVVVTLTAAYDRRAKFVRRTGNFMTRGPEYDLDQGVDVAALLNESFLKEAAAMGLAPSPAPAPWRISGTLQQAYLESRQVYMGATLFYGFLEVNLQITDPAGQTSARLMRTHSYSGAYNAGLGRRDEAEGAAARLIVEGAQEMLARLNRDLFKAPPHASMKALLDSVRSAGVEKGAADLWAVGLSGLPGAGPALIGMLPDEPREFLRARLINALGVLGARDAVALLGGRYAAEDEDPRYYTLKALDYIGGPEAEQLINTSGANDEDSGPKRLAGRIAGKPIR